MSEAGHALIMSLLDAYPSARQQFEALIRRDWAVRVLDCWAMSTQYARAYELVMHVMGSDALVIRVTGIGSRKKSFTHRGSTPDAARLAAAEAVWPELPESVRAEIGERP